MINLLHGTIGKKLNWLAVCLLLTFTATAGTQAPENASKWTIYITNDTCPDYTWGLTEEQTRQAFADIVRAHLDQMNLTDGQEPANRDCYNMAVTQEALCFVERYPERKDELIRRIKEGRISVSPYLCNALLAFQSAESAIRTFYPARRLEKEWGIPIDVAEHIEEPSLPWGTAPILAGCGIRWLSVAYLNYDCTFKKLKNPPVFIFKGPDKSKIRVIMDHWTSDKAGYGQGSYLLRKPDVILKEWLPHYGNLGKDYPIEFILASGTHGDISPKSGEQASGFADAIIKYNSQSGIHPKLVNATLPQFCQAIDRIQEKTPFLPSVSGCFGHSWDLWPVCLAKYAADMRQAERDFLSAESLLAIAAHSRRELHDATRADRERAEWCWTMLSDHAWNGTNNKNRRCNSELRRKWSQELNQISQNLLQQAWSGLGLKPSKENITIFNSLSMPRSGLVRVELPGDIAGVSAEKKDLTTQVLNEDGKKVLYFISPEIAGFGLMQLHLKQNSANNRRTDKLIATAAQLESPYYRLTIDANTGGIASLVHKANGTELVVPGSDHRLCQTIYCDGNEHLLTNIKSEVVADGPVLARLKITGTSEGITVTNFITVYAELDQVDFDLRINKPVTTVQQRLCQIFPVLSKEAVLKIETTGAVIRPQAQPEGDLLPGADTRRFAIQGFVNASHPDGINVTIAPLDAFALRLGLGQITFEALGNDQDYKEVPRDQDGVTNFRFRYTLRADTGGYRNADTISWSRNVSTPLSAALGQIDSDPNTRPAIEVDSKRAIATCFKPADGDASGGIIMRLWETAGRSGPISVGIKGYRKAILTDLLERNRRELPVVDNKVTVDLNASGFCAIRLLQ